MIDWFRSRRSLLAELRSLRFQRDTARLGHLSAAEDSMMWQSIASSGCSDTATHARLAHRLHVAEVALATERKVEPHQASRP